MKSSASELACAVCSTRLNGDSVIDVGGYPTCRSCVQKLSAEIASGARSKRRYTRVKNGRYLAGVCGGVADAIDVDRDTFRLLVVIGALMTLIAPFVITYVVLTFVLPVRD